MDPRIQKLLGSRESLLSEYERIKDPYLSAMALTALINVENIIAEMEDLIEQEGRVRGIA